MKTGPSVQVAPAACLNCGEVWDGATHVGDDEDRHHPEPGDCSICISCGHLMVFDNNLQFRELNDVEMQAMAGDVRVLAIQRARRRPS